MWFSRVAAFLVACSVSVAALAASPALSPYEKESLRLALEEVDGHVDSAPSGKWVEGTVVVSMDVVQDRDPAPNFLNWFHATSRSDVIEDEVLLRRGQRYDQALVDESERNLRAREQLSVVLIVPIEGSAKDRVKLLVVTKDVWSLRVNYEPIFVNNKLEYIALQPSEENLFGRHKILNANVTVSRATYSLGLGFTDPRVGGSRLQAAGQASLIFNCRTNDVEGSTGAFSYGKPLYSTQTKWSWVAAATWAEGIVRPAGTLGQSVCSDDRALPIDFAATPRVESIPYQFHQDAIQSQISATRSFGLAMKNDISFGLEASRAIYEPPDLSGQPLLVQREFASLLPVSDRRLDPFVQLHAYENRFIRVLDLETLGLQEDYRLGHDVWVRAYPAAQSLGSTRNQLGVYSAAGYTIPVWDGLARAYATSSIQISRPDQSDAAVSVGTRLVTPRLPFGRVVFDGFILDRYENYLNPLQSLGGTTRLRGYRASAFVGPDLVIGNIEIRSRPVQILTVQVGAAAFFDFGDAFRQFSQMSLKRGIGGGLRFAFPQIQRSVLRVDFGIPLDPRVAGAERSLVVEFEQAFDMPVLTSPGLVP